LEAEQLAEITFEDWLADTILDSLSSEESDDARSVHIVGPDAAPNRPRR
jgi:hypothetical protein